MKLLLERIIRTEHGVIGLLHLPDGFVPFTLEPEDRGNARNISCIPAGRYQIRRTASPRFGETFEVVGVPGRSAILFHAGNTEEDTEGCILLGLELGVLRVRDGGKKLAVLRSRRAFAGLLCALEGVQQAELEIVVPAGP